MQMFAPLRPLLSRAITGSLLLKIFTRLSSSCFFTNVTSYWSFFMRDVRKTRENLVSQKLNGNNSKSYWNSSLIDAKNKMQKREKVLNDKRKRDITGEKLVLEP